MESSTKPEYQKFTVRMAVQLAAPHTWPAAILPALVATSAAAATGHAISPIMACVLLAICILMQASVNTFNDYYDFVKGTDSADDDVEVSDATLVYNNVNPACALRLGIGFLVAAFLLGAYVIWQAGWIPLAIGVVGAVFVVVYSGGQNARFLPAHWRSRERRRYGRPYSACVLPSAHGRFELAHATVGSARDYWRGPDYDDEQHVRH